jgi:hypothetical protein
VRRYRFTHLLVRQLIDRSDLLDGLVVLDGQDAAAEGAEWRLGRTDEVS